MTDAGSDRIGPSLLSLPVVVVVAEMMLIYWLEVYML
jgi:hypothetical protein